MKIFNSQCCLEILFLADQVFISHLSPASIGLFWNEIETILLSRTLSSTLTLKLPLTICTLSLFHSSLFSMHSPLQTPCLLISHWSPSHALPHSFSFLSVSLSLSVCLILTHVFLCLSLSLISPSHTQYLPSSGWLSLSLSPSLILFHVRD